MPPFEYSFFLLPAEPVRTRLRAVIHDLAREFDAPEFDPHITLYHGPSTQDEARDLLAQIAGDAAPMELEALSFEHAAQYTKTFYVQFRESPEARRLSEAIRDNVAAPVAGYNFNPHLSLIYKNLDETRCEELCRRAVMPLGKMRFDAVCAIEFEPPWSDKSAREYQIIAEYGLREGFRRRADDMR